MDKKLKMSVGIGGPSIIMIFVVLSLTTLSALSLMTANSDWKLTKEQHNRLLIIILPITKRKKF